MTTTHLSGYGSPMPQPGGFCGLGTEPTWLPEGPTVEKAQRLTLLQMFISSSGRIGRRAFLLGQLAAVSVFAIGVALAEVGFERSFSLLSFVAMFMSVNLCVKRLHDRNESAWSLIYFLIPLINLFMWVDCVFDKGTAGPNRFGLATSPTPFG